MYHSYAHDSLSRSFALYTPRYRSARTCTSLWFITTQPGWSGPSRCSGWRVVSGELRSVIVTSGSLDCRAAWAVPLAWATHVGRTSYGGRTPGCSVRVGANGWSSAGRLDCHAAAARWLCCHRLSLRHGGQRACYRCWRECGVHSTTSAGNWCCDFLAGRRRIEYLHVLRQRPTSWRPGASHPPGRARCGDNWFSELREHWHTGCTAASDQFLGKCGPAPEL